MGTYVVIESDSPTRGQCFAEYNCLPDKSGTYAALYRPTHMIGLELGISVASAALRKEPTGAPIVLSTPMWPPPPSAPSRRARCWTARAASASGASRCRPTCH